ncbi:family 20 glycosylhydrolase [Chitinophaga agrisoli]|uniref:beta-N-acetylhexosaminidase n=1 Tax=Chitinophaga agrisoli TaxID=2607653 RepID=A0A5B2VXE6_9BACT|nr:family 20 glycosylhydrolase [Chitinophaga agrisoli]KAA2242876.1 family 20 glycosylhydrolase [Chitinophaga agrisoli]
MQRQLYLLISCLLVLSGLRGYSQSFSKNNIDSLPVRGFCIAAPPAAGVDSFITFIHKELAPRHINTLVLRVDYNYRYQRHPELADEGALTKQDVARLVKACKEHKIRIIPQVNLLGHQSWAGTLNSLLRVYPQFDETPHVKMPENYVWPNADGLYCKSYCPLHPEVHKVVFDLMDEICEVFETNAFHAGMDEVFYIGDDKCPRCGGRDKAELFAGEVRTLRDHLALQGRELWIWGDRLLDGKTTGMGMWEASLNNTYRAVDMIPKDVMICDWHYDRADKSAVYFAMKGLRVITCPWRKPEVATEQLDDMLRFQASATKEMKPMYQGIMQTIWSPAPAFLREYYGGPRIVNRRNDEDSLHTQTNCFKAVFK